jgi:hypothetical protein
MALTLLRRPTESAREFHSALMTAAPNMGGGRTVVDLRGEAGVSSRPVLCDMLCQVIAEQVGDVIIDWTT